MIDIHCHILPGLDDGAQTIEESLAMARAAEEQGVTKIVATPHHLTTRFQNPEPSVRKKVQELNERLKEENIAVEILTGQEVRISGSWEEEFEAGRLATLNGTHYILVEFPSNHVPGYAGRLFYDMQLKGLTPVIAHPERNSQIIGQPDKLYELIEKGALSQVTASSVSGYFGKKVQKFSLQLIEANLAHCIASDAHDTAARPSHLPEAFQKVEKEFGPDYASLFQENARLIVEGKMIYREDPQPVRRRKIFGLF